MFDCGSLKDVVSIADLTFCKNGKKNNRQEILDAPLSLLPKVDAAVPTEDTTLTKTLSLVAPKTS